MRQYREAFEVRVSREERDHSGTHWTLFAQYPSRFEAYQALERARDQGYRLAQLIDRSTFTLTD